MRICLRFERVYGTPSQYGEKPRESPPGSPIVLEDYPLPRERVTIHLGRPVEKLYRENRIARAGGFSLVRRNVAHENLTAEDEAEALRKAQAEPLGDSLTRWNWYITIVIERWIDVPDALSIPGRLFSVDPVFALRTEDEFRSYASHQADFVVDHLKVHLSPHFFQMRDVDDRVVFLPEGGQPFKNPKMTLGQVTVSTTGPMHSLDIPALHANLSKLRDEGELHLGPLTPATLVSVIERASTPDLKGRALEELVAKLFATISGLTVVNRVRTATEEVDIAVFNESTRGFLASEEAVILAECKNWSGKCGRDEFSMLEKKAENRRSRCSLAILVSWNGFTGTIDKELLRSSRQRLMIIPISKSELVKAVADNDFLGVLESAWRATVLT
jgi:hypothetical protein